MYTIGHSTRTIETFLRLLQAHGVRMLVDIRTIPRSRHNPQFNRDALPGSLGSEGIQYLHIAELGGLRPPAVDSPNGDWRNKSFRGFADYMQTPDFAAGLEQLTRVAALQRTAIMCAEAVPWRCHRTLVADALQILGYGVEHIMGPKRAQQHSLTEFAKVRGKRITYPPSE